MLNFISRFEVDDSELGWTYTKVSRPKSAAHHPSKKLTKEQDSFDFIHARNICHSFKLWSAVLGQVMAHLKPGDWFELAEVGTACHSEGTQTTFADAHSASAPMLRTSSTLMTWPRTLSSVDAHQPSPTISASRGHFSGILVVVTPCQGSCIRLPLCDRPVSNLAHFPSSVSSAEFEVLPRN